jgi:hypothetical protein
MNIHARRQASVVDLHTLNVMGDKLLIHVDTEKSELLVKNRFAYVSVSRAQHDAHIYTNDGRQALP